MTNVTTTANRGPTAGELIEPTEVQESPKQGNQQQQRNPTTKQRNNSSNKRLRRVGSSRKWKYQKPTELTLAQETVFLNMQLRKTSRALSGAKTRDTNYEFFALAVLLVIIYSLGVNARYDDVVVNTTFFVTLSFNQVITIGVWLFVAAFVTATFAQSRFIELLYWMFIYLPLLAIVSAFMFDTDGTVTEGLQYSQLFVLVLVIAEILAVLVFVLIFYAYPKYINSNGFRRRRRAAKFWRIQPITDFTMTYISKKKFWEDRHVCKYQGDVCPRTGLPNGIGRWFDDSKEGEILTGSWKDGIPVAPFMSRHYGRGDLFLAVRIGYVMASDDDFDTSKFWPSNDQKPTRCGIASVECSVAGHFYNELPCATLLVEESEFDETASMEKLCKELTHIGGNQGIDDPHNTLQIKASDRRGIHIPGYVHGHTGKTFNKVDEIVIRVKPIVEPINAGDDAAAVTQKFQQQTQQSRNKFKMEHMPFSKRKSLMHPQERIVVRDDSSDDDDDDGEDDNKFNDESGDSVVPVVKVTPLVSMSMASISEDDGNDDDGNSKGDGDEVEVGLAQHQNQPPPKQNNNNNNKRKNHHLRESTNAKQSDVTLQIQDWIPSKHKDALIFLAGFNCPLNQALQGFGQFIAMTKLDSTIYPILFGWPCGQVLSYHSASRASHRPSNKANFLSMLHGLQHAGIRNVHLMSHSMGAQTLVGVFCDKEDGSRSDVSLCFKQAAGWEEGNHTNNKTEADNDKDDDDTEENNLLVCKTLTMLNPDFPLDSFVRHSYKSLRRICGNITIVGDRTDFALLMSQMVNGIGVYFGYQQPPEMLPNIRNKQTLKGQPVIGRCIHKLYLPEKETPPKEEGDGDDDDDDINECLLFTERAPMTIVADDDEDDLDRAWLDLDVIDTSGLDTNIAGIRHSAFNMNPILLNDLEELVRTNNRAMKRTSLLYREGNMFSYCHAPSFVAY